ncbi:MULTISPECIES: DUF2516 family protein [Thermomonospora]|uniref:DUF2516 family protein n=1 Tax=Thermomonospora cellulosilytica TaxID=1411118 RepID=A0A7W3MWK1_9ACTN|nr:MULTISPECIES: DUF2516 family protein [Thermomonospora]MBA9003237.1 hypothetical protein [Thermomonospora cellulosilytica]
MWIGLVYFFWFLAIVAFLFEVFALVDALRTPAGAYAAASKQSKNLWVILLVVANVVGLAGAAGMVSLIQILPIAAFVVAAIYLADVRPAVAPYRKRGGGSASSGPYGPW